MTIILIIYLLIAISFGYWNAREVYRGNSRDIPPRSTGWSISIMIIYGLSWPILFIGALFFVLVQTKTWNKIGEKLFG